MCIFPLQIAIAARFLPPLYEYLVVTYFKPDYRKDGSSYEKVRGAVRWIDEGEMKVVFADGTRIAIEDMCYIEGETFKEKF